MAGALTFVGLSLLMAYRELRPAGPAARADHTLLIADFLACAAMMIVGLWLYSEAQFSRPALKLDSTGFSFHPLLPLQPVILHWRHIDSFHTTDEDGLRGKLVVHLADPDRYISELPAARQRQARKNLEQTGSPLVLTPALLSTPVDELVPALNDFLEGHRAGMAKKRNVGGPVARRRLFG